LYTHYINKSGGDEEGVIWDYGLRLTAQIDINKFVISGEYSSSLNKLGSFYGIKIGYKFH
jgi:hypothetical protein